MVVVGVVDVWVVVMGVVNVWVGGVVLVGGKKVARGGLLLVNTAGITFVVSVHSKLSQCNLVVRLEICIFIAICITTVLVFI